MFFQERLCKSFVELGGESRELGEAAAMEMLWRDASNSMGIQAKRTDGRLTAEPVCTLGRISRGLWPKELKAPQHARALERVLHGRCRATSRPFRPSLAVPTLTNPRGPRRRGFVSEGRLHLWAGQHDESLVLPKRREVRLL